MDDPQTFPPPFRNTSKKAFPENDSSAAEDWVRSPKTSGLINFISPSPKWAVEKPFQLALPLPTHQPKSNTLLTTHKLSITDGRGNEDKFALDTHGFQFESCPCPNVDFDDNQAIERDYLAPMEMFLRDFLGASSIKAFDYTVRQVKPKGEGYKWEEHRPPAKNAHCDQTPEAVMARLKLYYGADSSEYAHKRVRLINIWRPLKGPIRNNPLAVLDSRSLAEDDLVAQDMVYPHYVGEDYSIKFNGNHRWYYWSDMEPSDIILIKNFDSILDGRARLCPHAAFTNLGAASATELRKSIEVRLLVFDDDEKV